MAPPPYNPATFWDDLDALIEQEHYWRAVALLDEAEVNEQFAHDAEAGDAIPLGITGMGLSIPILYTHDVIYKLPFRVLPGTRDYAVNAGHAAWNSAAYYWATNYNLTLIGRSDLYRQLDEGDITDEEFREMIESNPTTKPE